MNINKIINIGAEIKKRELEIVSLKKELQSLLKDKRTTINPPSPSSEPESKPTRGTPITVTDVTEIFQNGEVITVTGMLRKMGKSNSRHKELVKLLLSMKRKGMVDRGEYKNKVGAVYPGWILRGDISNGV